MVGMHTHIIPNRNSTPAVLLRESYRVGGNVRKRTLANLSKLPMDAVDGAPVCWRLACSFQAVCPRSRRSNG